MSCAFKEIKYCSYYSVQQRETSLSGHKRKESNKLKLLCFSSNPSWNTFRRLKLKHFKHFIKQKHIQRRKHQGFHSIEELYIQLRAHNSGRRLQTRKRSPPCVVKHERLICSSLPPSLPPVHTVCWAVRGHQHARVPQKHDHPETVYSHPRSCFKHKKPNTRERKNVKKETCLTFIQRTERFTNISTTGSVSAQSSSSSSMTGYSVSAQSFCWWTSRTPNLRVTDPP